MKMPEADQTKAAAPVLLAGRPGRGRDALCELLRSPAASFNVITADSGLLALKIARQNELRAVIIAAGLPDSEIVELVAQLKQHYAHLPCLALVDSSETQREALLAGADAVMPNGSYWGQLLPIIQRMLEE